MSALLAEHFDKLILYVPSFISSLSFLVSFVALWYSIDKDKKKAVFHLYIGKKIPLNDLKRLEQYPDYICGSLVNIGRRPICILRVGGDYKETISERIKRVILKKGTLYHLIFPDREIYSAINEEDGSPKIIKEGEIISFDFISHLEKNLSKDNRIKQIDDCKKIKCLYAQDVDGTKYYLGKTAFRKYISSSINLLNKSSPE